MLPGVLDIRTFESIPRTKVSQTPFKAGGLGVETMTRPCLLDPREAKKSGQGSSQHRCQRNPGWEGDQVSLART